MLKRNLIANCIGQGWVALMGLAFIPIYVKYLGIEAYGLIGFFAMLQGWLAILDIGMTPTLNREMARFSGGGCSALSIRDLLRSIEVVIFIIGVLISIGVWAASGWLANQWIRAESLPIATVNQAISMMGVVIAFRFMESIYRSCIVGLQRQVLFNIVYGIVATLRFLGAACILIWVSASIKAFFIWQAIISLLSVTLLAYLTYSLVPKAERSGYFSLDSLRTVCRFAGGMIGITVLALLLTQVDKVLLSKLLTLSEFGRYTLAAVVASALTLVAAPITQAWFPHLCELYAQKRETELIAKFHQGAQLVSVLLGSAAIIVIVNAVHILQAWTHDPELAQRTAPLLILLALGNLLNGLMWIPYQTQLAYGWTGLAIRINIISVLLIVPAIVWVTPRYGAEGAAWVWVTLNAGYVFIGIHFMYSKILIHEKMRWYYKDLFQPLAGAMVVVLLLYFIQEKYIKNINEWIWLPIVAIMALLCSAFSSTFIRKALLVHIRLAIIKSQNL